MAQPTSQKADVRPIGFVLDNLITGQITSLNLVVRPEELTRPAPSRLAATQTFGGAFVDGWGAGLSSIQISGHTGWRGGLFQDGAAAFQQLKTTVFDQWHAQRAAAVSGAQDPGKVQLIFADVLDNVINIVVPTNFTLKRSRSRPLLMMYQISMIVVSETVDRKVTAQLVQDAASKAAAGAASLTYSVNTISAAVPRLATFMPLNLVQPFAAFMNQSLAAFNAVLAAPLGVVNAVSNDILAAASDLATIGRNAFYSVLAIASLPIQAAYTCAQLAAEYENALCVLLNVFQIALTFPDFSDIFGASLCSSTVDGASPLSPFAVAGTNPFAAAAPLPGPGVAVTPPARASMSTLINTDPVLAPPTSPQLGAQLSTVSAGVMIP